MCSYVLWYDPSWVAQVMTIGVQGTEAFSHFVVAVTDDKNEELAASFGSTSKGCKQTTAAAQLQQQRI